MKIPDGWKKTNFVQCVTILTGYPFKSSDYTDNEKDIRLLRGDNVVQGYLRWENVKKWSVEKLDYLTEYQLSAKDVVIAMDRTWVNAGLKVAAVKESDLPCLLVQRVARLKAKSKLSQAYLCFLVRNYVFEQYVKEVQTESAVPHISKSQIDEYPILLPPLPEQKAIAAILETWDRAIEKTERLIDAKQKRFDALLQKLIVENGKLKKGKGGWKIVKLGDVCEVLTSNVDKKTNSGETQVRLCNYMDVYRNFYITNLLDFMCATATETEINKYALLKDDVVITKDSETPDDIANSACVAEDLDGVVCGYHLAILRPELMLNGPYLNYTLHTRRIRYDFSRHANGVTRFGLTMKAYNLIDIPLPPIKEQKQIAETLDASQKEIDLLKKLVEKYKTQKNGLMQKLLTGEWRVLCGTSAEL